MVARWVAAYLVLLCWHGVVIVVFLAVVDRQSGLREGSSGSSPQEEMMLLGAGTVPGFLCTLLVGAFVLWGLLEMSRVRSAVLLGTAATWPTFLLVAAAILIPGW